ncbi:MAG: VOC family protein [Caldilineaceae bacterium]|nr:VOC family protein [Caldilineaceae bacterium]
MTTYTRKRDPGQPVWFDLATPDLEQAKQFYREIFGWDFVDTGENFGHYNLALAQGRSAAGMAALQPDAQMPSAWTVYFSSDNAAADAARVQELGGQVLMDTMPVGPLGTMAICADPTGAVFGLWQAGEHFGFGVEGEHGAFAWCEVNTPNAAATSEFYGKLFDLTAHPMQGGDTEYFIMQRGEKMICGVLQMDARWEGIPPHWMNYFYVDNTDATIEKATAAGGTLMVPAFDIPYGRMAVLNDPGNASFSIVLPPAGA